MRSSESPDVCVSGLGITSAIGQGRAEFTAALRDGRHNFGIMQRAGRQAPATSANGSNTEHATAFLGAELRGLTLPASLPEPARRVSSLSAQVALATLQEAWDDARLGELDPSRIGLVIGGSNLQQRELVQTHAAYRDRAQYLRPTYAVAFMDSDLCGACTESFAIRAFAYTLGGASASGQAAVIHAAQAVESGQVDACIALGALMDLSYWECQGFRSLGAMGSDRFARDPARACRPFDRDRDGFVYGEGCGALVIESARSVARRGAGAYARVSGWAMTMDGNRNPNPSFEGEVSAIETCLKRAGVCAGDIDYVNLHGTGSIVGDETELRAIRHCRLDAARLNATKSITGHTLTAAGAVELVATLVQMREGWLHPTRNLEQPIDPDLAWVEADAAPHRMNNALKLSMGFGGINTAVCLQRL